MMPEKRTILEMMANEEHPSRGWAATNAIRTILEVLDKLLEDQAKIIRQHDSLELTVRNAEEYRKYVQEVLQ